MATHLYGVFYYLQQESSGSGLVCLYIYFLVITASCGQFYDARWVSWTLVKSLLNLSNFLKGFPMVLICCRYGFRPDTSLVFYLSRFLRLFKNTLYAILRYPKFLLFSLI